MYSTQLHSVTVKSLDLSFQLMAQFLFVSFPHCTISMKNGHRHWTSRAAENGGHRNVISAPRQRHCSVHNHFTYGRFPYVVMLHCMCGQMLAGWCWIVGFPCRLWCLRRFHCRPNVCWQTVQSGSKRTDARLWNIHSYEACCICRLVWEKWRITRSVTSSMETVRCTTSKQIWVKTTNNRLFIVNMLNLLWSILSNWARRFGLSATDLVHVLVSRVLPQISAANLVVDGRQMVSLVSVRGRGSLFNIYSLLNFPIVSVGFTH